MQNNLYHFTEIDNLLGILESGKIHKYKCGYCCASKNKFLQKNIKDFGSIGKSHLLHANVSITLDISKIKAMIHEVNYADVSYYLENKDLLKHILGGQDFKDIITIPEPYLTNAVKNNLKKYKVEDECIILADFIGTDCISGINFYTRYNDFSEKTDIEELKSICEKNNLKLNILDYNNRTFI